MVSQRVIAGVLLAFILVMFLFEKHNLETQARAARKAQARQDSINKKLRDFHAIAGHHMRTPKPVPRGGEAHPLPPRIVDDEPAQDEKPVEAVATPAPDVPEQGGAEEEQEETPKPVAKAKASKRRASDGARRGYRLDFSEEAAADPVCPLPPLHPHKWAAKFGWGVRKQFPQCGLNQRFSRVVERHSSVGNLKSVADVFFFPIDGESDSPACGPDDKLQAFGFEELKDADFKRMDSTYAAEMRQNDLKARFSMENIRAFGKELAHPKAVDENRDAAPVGAHFIIRGVEHPYVMAVCGKHHELHVRQAPDRQHNKVPKPEEPESGRASKEVPEGGIQNVLHIMFDSTSIHAMRRGSKKIVKWMEELNNRPSSPSYVYPMKHYHAVSCCSPGNQIPVYSGNMNGEGDRFVKSEPKQNSKDWLWNIAATRGFRTFWSLDNCPDKSARDYHAFPSVHSRVVSPLCLAGVLLSHKDATCLAGKTVDAHVLDGLKSFWEHHADESKFAAVQFITPHEESEKLLIELDILVHKYFAELEASGELNRTAVIFWSDHGINFGKYASTHDGEIEKMFPFINFMLPKWFIDQNPSFDKSLRRNADRLVTPYDVYEAARTLLYYPEKPPNFAHDPHNPPLPRPEDSHIMASFQKPITPVDIISHEVQAERTCMEANIPMEFCTCLPWKPAEKSSRGESSLQPFFKRAVAHHKALLVNLTKGSSSKCLPVEKPKLDGIEVQEWPTEYKPKHQTHAKKIWMSPNRDMVKVLYHTGGAGAGEFEAVFSVRKDDDSVFDVASINRLDAMKKKCGIVDKITEHMCVCR